MFKFDNLKLINKIIIIMFIIFLVITAFFWTFSNYLTQKIDEGWAVKYINKHLAFDRYKTLNPIISELTKVNKLKKDIDIINFAQDDFDPVNIEKAINTLEEYRENFKNKNYFLALKNSQHYYYNNRENEYKENPLIYTLDKNKKSDKWFFTSIKENKDFNINVDKDINLNVTNIWLNVLIRDDNQEVLGVVGTGFNFDSFIKDNLESDNTNVKNYFIKEDLSIQLAQESSQVDYASFTKEENQKKKIDFYFEDNNDILNIKSAMNKLKDSDIEDVELIWVNKNDTKKLVGITYLPQIDWYSLTIIDSNELTTINKVEVFFILILILITLLIVIYLVLNHLIFGPLDQFNKQIKSVKSYKENAQLTRIGSSEIAKLSDDFNDMLNTIVIEIKKNKEKEKLIIEQSQLAELGNMFNNIIHQWKQPLNLISINVSAIQVYYNAGICDKNEINKQIDSIFETIVYMDNTLQDFKSYLDPNKIKKEFSIKDAFEKINTLLKFRFSKTKTKLDLNFEDNYKILGYEGEFLQVILNILNNSLDNFEKQELLNKEIKVSCFKDNGNIVLKIEDNGGGIPNELLPNRLFEEYITTKHKNGGSGIGLYLCKQIIEEHFKGQINVTNKEDKAIFTMVLPFD